MKKSKTFKSAKSLWFYIAILALPVLQFCVFYIAVNINSFVLAFRNITLDGETKKYVFSWTFDNFKNWPTKTNFCNLLRHCVFRLNRMSYRLWSAFRSACFLHTIYSKSYPELCFSLSLIHISEPTRQLL